MKGIDKLSLVAGIVMTVVGAGMLIASIFIWPLVFYAVGIFVIGIVILITLRQQEHIEPIRKKGKGGK